MNDSAEGLERLAAAFEQVRDAAGAERESAIAAACAGDVAFERALRSLLTHHDAPPDALDAPVLHLEVSARPAPALPARIGRYRLLRVLGEGGMGVVHLAEQERPRRLVALKTVRPGLARSTAARRFAQEGELLGRLQHPGIAAIHEAGMTDLGAGAQPWFAMEYVAGEPITAYADAHELDVPARLRLVIDVADALQHAHERGVVHRDLKPANILVDAHGRPRILDFGVARAVGPEVPLTTIRTDAGQLIGTLPYMSPEQLDGAVDLDHRADVYALGVLAYELLTGRLPHDVRGASMVETLARLRDEEPTALATVDPAFRGDLDVIIGTALTRERERRYDSARAFARDLERHLGDEPIVARPPSVVYRTRKFVRRHRTLVAALVTIAIVLVAATVIALRLAVVAEERRRDADALARARAEEVIVARIGEAARDLTALGGREAAARLDALPPRTARRWEVQYLRAQLDDSSAAITLPQTVLRALHAVPEDGMSGMSGMIGLTDGGTIVAHPGAAHADDVWRTIGETNGAATALAAADADVIVAVENGAFVGRRTIDGERIWRAETAALTGTVSATRDASLVAGVERGIGFVVIDGRDGSIRARRAAPRALDVLALAPSGASAIVRQGGTTGGAQWSLESGAVTPLVGHVDRVTAARYSRDGAWLATADGSGVVILRDGATGAVRSVLPPLATRTQVHALEFDADGTRLFAGTETGAIMMWPLASLDDAAVHHLPVSRVVAMLWDDETAALVASGLIDHAYVIDDVMRASVPPLAMATDAVTVPRADAVAIVGASGAVRLVCAVTGDVLQSRALGTALLRGVGTDPAGRVLAVVDNAGNVSGVELATGASWTHAIDDEPLFGAVAVLADGAVAAGCRDGTIVVCANDGAERGRWTLAARVSALARDAAGTRLASGSADGSIQIWHPDGTPDGAPVALSGSVRTVTWPGGDAFFATTELGDVARIDLTSRAVDWTRRTHSGAVEALAISPDGRRGASGGVDGLVRLFDPADGTVVLTLGPLGAPVHGVAFSADGSALHASTLDGRHRTWSTRRASARAALRALRQAVGEDAVPEAADAAQVEALRRQRAVWPAS